MSRFFEGSRMFAKSSRAEEDSAGNARSPSREAPSETVKKVQINNHRNMAVVVDTDGKKIQTTTNRDTNEVMITLCHTIAIE